jgi:hypothetical protein
MLTFFGASRSRFCDRVSRRDFLKVGGLLGCLSLADLLRLQAETGTGLPHRSVIMVYLHGGPSHIDTYDMKPDAPIEYRGEFKPIQTNVTGFDICELMPLQARIADKLALIRNLKFNPNFHDPVELLSGFRKPTEGTAAARPDIGSVVSKLESHRGPRELPAYIALDKTVGHTFLNGPAYLGQAHKAFIPGDKLESIKLPRNVSLERLQQRRALLGTFDQLRRELDNSRGDLAGMDAFTTQAFDMVTSPRARDAFDLSQEPLELRQRYGPAQRLLQARRLAEAGVPLVTLTLGERGSYVAATSADDRCSRFTWDTHEDNFRCLRRLVPPLDQGVHALVTDLHERGLDRDVLVLVWGEMGRTPKIGQSTGNGSGSNGRDHWVRAGFALLAGGGLPTGQVIGRTDARAENPVGVPYTPQNVLATLYRFLGIDPATTTLLDHSGRPVHLLDDPRPVRELQ